MDVELLKQKLRFSLIPTRPLPETGKQELLLAYNCWKEVWISACRDEMNVMETLYSDNFTKQSHAAVLWMEDEPVAVATLNHLDLSCIIDLDDSYFKIWPEIALHKLKKENKKIMTCGNFALNFNYRRGALGVSGKELLFAVLVWYLRESDRDSMIAAVRLEKGMEKAAYRTGAVCLQKDIPYSIPGQRVDLVSWRKSLDVDVMDPKIRDLSNSIWKHSSVNKGAANAA